MEAFGPGVIFASPRGRGRGHGAAGSCQEPFRITPEFEDFPNQGALVAGSRFFAVWEAVRIFQAKANIKWKKVGKKKLGTAPNTREILSPWRRGDFSINGLKFSPREFVERLADVPGFVITSVAVKPDGRKLTWEISGRVYVSVPTS